jgi:catechol 1,2-dioxygenase
LTESPHNERLTCGSVLLRNQFYVEAAGHKTLVTQVFDRESKYLDDDAVFAVKVRFFRNSNEIYVRWYSLSFLQDKLVVDFNPVKAPLPKGGEFDEEIKFELEYNISLAKDSEGNESSSFQG